MMQLTILSSPDQIAEHGTTFSVSHLLWGTKHAPAVTGSIGYVQEDGFYVEMICEESDPLRRYEGLYAPVYLDSAMEAFFHFPFVGKRKSEPSPYLNLEFNANGALLAQYGYSRTKRTPLSPEECQSLAYEASLCGDFWKVHFRLPSLFLKRFTESPDFSRKTAFPVIFTRSPKIRTSSTTRLSPRY